jgi:hypothetical protein
MAVKIRVSINLDQIGEGMGSSAVGQSQARNPGMGQGLGPGTVGSGQTMELLVGEQVLGTDGALTLANIQTALTNIANDFAGASGTPIITAALLAQINAWNSGSP